MSFSIWRRRPSCKQNLVRRYLGGSVNMCLTNCLRENARDSETDAGANFKRTSNSGRDWSFDRPQTFLKKPKFEIPKWSTLIPRIILLETNNHIPNWTSLLRAGHGNPEPNDQVVLSVLMVYLVATAFSVGSCEVSQPPPTASIS